MNLDRIAKLLPLGAVILIGLGVLKASVYYNYFGVDIMSYLSTSEVLTLFLNDYESIIVLFIIGFIHFDLSEKTIDFTEKVTGLQIFEWILKKGKWIFFLVSLFLTVLLIIRIQNQSLPLKNGWIYFFCFNLSNVFHFLLINRNMRQEMHYSKRLAHFFQITSLTLIVPLFALKDIRVIEHNQGKKINLTLKNSTIIKSTKHFKYIGKASENYFFYNPKDKMTTIIKSENVEQIEIKK